MSKLEEYMKNERKKLEQTEKFIEEKRKEKQLENFKTNYFILKKDVIVPALKKAFEEINNGGFAKAELKDYSSKLNYMDEYTDSIDITRRKKHIRLDIIGQYQFNYIYFKFTSDITRNRFIKGNFQEMIYDFSKLTTDLIDEKIIKMLEILK